MAKKAKASGETSREAPKDEVALKTPNSGSSKKAKPPVVDGSSVTSSGRKVRINEGSPAQGVKRRAEERDTTTAVMEPGDKKFSPKHKDKVRGQPEKSALKPRANGTRKGKKRKAEDGPEAEEVTEEAETSTAGAAPPNTFEDDEATNGEIDFLAGFESGSDEEGLDEDSSDEEAGEPVSVQQLPAPTRKSEKTRAAKKEVPGVIYLGRIPHGFHEDEMRSYFSQFGEVKRLRLSRNKTTGASKHYAFIEFQHASVAEIVAETMDNYLLTGHILQCKVVPPDEIHPKLWVGANKKFRPIPKGRVERSRHNAPKTDEQKASITNRLVKRENAKRTKLKELGIEYDFDGYVKTLPEKQVKDQKEEQKAIKSAQKLEEQVKKDQEEVNQMPHKATKPNKRPRKSA